jgi:hypothetical protein
MRPLFILGDKIVATKAPQTEKEDEITEVAETIRALLGEDTFNGESLNTALQTLYEEMGVGEDGDAMVHISKLDTPTPGKESNVWKDTPDKYDLHQIAQTFGSGEYRVRVYVKGSTGHRVVKANKVFSWLLTPQEEQRLKNPPSTEAPITAQSIASIVAETVRNMMPQTQAPAIDPLMMMNTAIAMAKQLTPPPQPQIGILELLQMQKEMLAIKRESEPPPAREGGSNVNDVVIAMAETFGPTLAGLIARDKAMQAAQAQQAQPVQQLPQPEPLPMAEPMTPLPDSNNFTNEESTDDMNAMAMMKLKMGISFLISQAKAGNDVATYADMIFDNVPGDALVEILKQADPVQWLINIEPKVSEYRAWFTLLLDECKNMVQEEPEA